MENLEIKVNSGLKKIKVNEYGDTIILNLEDSSISGRYAKLIENLERIAEEAECEGNELEKKYKDRPVMKDEDIDTEQVIEKTDFRIRYIEQMIEEIENVLGKDAIRKVYRECYEADEQFIPTEAAIIEFIDQMNPVMTQLYKERFEFNKKKYSRKRVGKNRVSKKELIQGYGR